MATFNEFQRELQRRGIDPQNAYMFTLLYERQIQIAKLCEDTAKVLTELVNSIQGLVQLHESTQGKMKQLLTGGLGDDARVESVANDPDEDPKH